MCMYVHVQMYVYKLYVAILYVLSKLSVFFHLFTVTLACAYIQSKKIINPLRKSDVTVRHLHNISRRFESAIGLRMKLVKEFQELVPDSMSFNVGYFEGQNDFPKVRSLYGVMVEEMKKRMSV